MQERQVTVYNFLKACRLSQGTPVSDLLAPVEELLLDRRYAAFIERALAVSDAWQRHQLSDLEGFRNWCCRIAGEIAGQELEGLPQLYHGPELPEPLRLALEALVRGVEARIQTVSD